MPRTISDGMARYMIHALWKGLNPYEYGRVRVGETTDCGRKESTTEGRRECLRRDLRATTASPRYGGASTRIIPFSIAYFVSPIAE